jgi:hypothetical protein
MHAIITFFSMANTQLQQNNWKNLYCQILVEIHSNVDRKTQNKETVYYTVNGFNLSICDFSFIHKSCLQKYGIEIVLGTIFL